MLVKCLLESLYSVTLVLKCWYKKKKKRKATWWNTRVTGTLCVFFLTTRNILLSGGLRCTHVAPLHTEWHKSAASFALGLIASFTSASAVDSHEVFQGEKIVISKPAIRFHLLTFTSLSKASLIWIPHLCSQHSHGSSEGALPCWDKKLNLLQQ